MSYPSALIIVENQSVPFDRRVWREAQTLRDAGWQVSVISPKALRHSHKGAKIVGEDAEYELLDGIHIYRYPLETAEGGPLGFAKEYLTAFAHTARLVMRVWRKHGLAVMQICNPPDFFFPFGWVCRLVRKGFIFDHHDLVPESVAERWRGWKGYLLLKIARLAERLTMQTASVIISTNESYREIAVKRGHFSPERVFVVRNGPLLRSLPRLEPDPGLKKGRRYLVGYLGIMGPQDGLEVLLEAIRIVILEMKRRDIQFLLAGDGPMRPWLHKHSQAWDISDFVTLPGLAVRWEDWGRYLSSCDLCVAPEPPTAFNMHSTITKIAEYMAMGKPIVAFNLKETRYTAQEAAVYVEEFSPRALGNAIFRLLEDRQKRMAMAEFGKQRVHACLSWESQEPRLLEAYQTALSYDCPREKQE